MTAGRKPASNAHRRFRGDRASAFNPSEPSFPVAGEAGAPPEPPATLCRVGAAEWCRLAPILVSRGVLTVADLGIFEAYCSMWAQYSAAAHTLRRAAASSVRQILQAQLEAPVRAKAKRAGREPTAEELAAVGRAEPTPEEISRGEREGRGLLYQNTHKNLAANPALAVKNQAAKLLTSLASELGLTPASRARVKADLHNNPADPWSEFQPPTMQ